jgi:hypothetical protein
MGSSMGKIGLFLAVLAVAAMPAVAEAAKKGKKRVARPAAQTAQPVQPVDTNEASARLVRGAIPIFLPTWALPFYLSTPTGRQDHPNQAPHLLNPQGTQSQPAKKTRRAKQARG